MRLVEETEPVEIKYRKAKIGESRERTAGRNRNRKSKMTFAHPWFLLLLLLLPLLAWLKGRRGLPPAFVYSSVQLVRAMQNISRSRAGRISGGVALAGAGDCSSSRWRSRVWRKARRR